MQLAQLNIARMLAPLGSKLMKEFEDNLDPINQLAEKSPGFVWRLKDDNNNATSVDILGDEYLLVNMSVWEQIDHLFNFVYQSNHFEIFRRKSEWFSKMDKMHLVMWYVDNECYPTTQEAVKRLLHLRAHGETPYAFSFRKRFTTQDLVRFLNK